MTLSVVSFLVPGTIFSKCRPNEFICWWHDYTPPHKYRNPLLLLLLLCAISLIYWKIYEVILYVPALVWGWLFLLSFIVPGTIFPKCRPNQFICWWPSVLWHCWLGHMTRKTVSEMTYNVSSGTLNSTIPYHTCWWHWLPSPKYSNPSVFMQSKTVKRQC